MSQDPVTTVLLVRVSRLTLANQTTDAVTLGKHVTQTFILWIKWCRNYNFNKYFNKPFKRPEELRVPEVVSSFSWLNFIQWKSIQGLSVVSEVLYNEKYSEVKLIVKNIKSSMYTWMVWLFSDILIWTTSIVSLVTYI